MLDLAGVGLVARLLDGLGAIGDCHQLIGAGTTKIAFGLDDILPVVGPRGLDGSDMPADRDLVQLDDLNLGAPQLFDQRVDRLDVMRQARLRGAINVIILHGLLVLLLTALVLAALGPLPCRPIAIVRIRRRTGCAGAGSSLQTVLASPTASASPSGSSIIARLRSQASAAASL